MIWHLYIGVVYCPPSYIVTDDDNLINIQYNFCSGNEVLLLGDFNLPSIHWGSVLQCGGLTFTDVQFCNCFISLGLTHWATEPTFLTSGNILDLVFTSECNRMGEIKVFPPFPNCGYRPIPCSSLFQALSPALQTISHTL